jgi:hypothetical protein
VVGVAGAGPAQVVLDAGDGLAVAPAYGLLKDASEPPRPILVSHLLHAHALPSLRPAQRDLAGPGLSRLLEDPTRRKRPVRQQLTEERPRLLVRRPLVTVAVVGLGLGPVARRASIGGAVGAGADAGSGFTISYPDGSVRTRKSLWIRPGARALEHGVLGRELYGK